MTFVHPGALDTRANLDFVKARIAAGDQPWTREFNKIRGSTSATRGPSQLTHIVDHHDAAVARDDALAAYTQALLWWFTGDENYAERSIAILNTWSKLKGFTLGTDQDKLRAGWIGAVFAPAAEIMRSYNKWTPARIAELQAMFRRAFYPQLDTASSWNGNVDLTQTDALISIAVFNEDEEMFRLALARLERRNPAYFYLTSDGAEPAPIAGDGGDLQHFWSDPVDWVDGLNQETCRDNGHHSQYALGSALHVAEVAWNQGVDVYTPNQARYTAALELLASQFLSDSFATCKITTPATGRFNTWEVGYNHYHNRVGVDLPNTKKFITQQIRTDSVRAAWNLVYETLTHADLHIDKEFALDENGRAAFNFAASPVLWTPDNPKLYELNLSYKGSVVKDRVGFRTIRVDGENIILNGESVFLRGISIHEESPRRPLPGIQDLWNRKGLLSEKGARKQAWCLMKDWYAVKKTQY